MISGGEGLQILNRVQSSSNSYTLLA